MGTEWGDGGRCEASDDHFATFDAVNIFNDIIHNP